MEIGVTRIYTDIQTPLMQQLVMKKLLFILTGFCLFTHIALADVRNALVIGNGEYEQVGALDNPTNDAKLMAETLRSLDFNVIEVINASQIDMKRAVRDFGTRLNEAGREGVGLFYYAGHGVQVGGANYIIPVDAKIQGEGDVDIEAVNANSVLSMMEYSNARLSFVILDACRNNPYSRGFRSAARGLAKMNAPTGSFIAYATSPGDVAVDGDGNNSPYTAALVANMEEPGVPIEKMFRNVRNQVRSITDNRQTPWESSSLIGDDFYFKTKVEIANKPSGQEVTVSTELVPADPAASSDGVNVTPPAAAMQPLVIRNDSSVELLFWESVNDSKNPALIQAYLNKYPEGIFVELARLKLEALATKKPVEPAPAKPVTQVVVSKVPTADTSPTPSVDKPSTPVTLAAVSKSSSSGNVLRKKLDQCAAHIRAKRLTTGAGGNALDCYRDVLDTDPGNKEALSGLVAIEDKYAQWASTSIESGNLERAARNIRKLRAVNEEHPKLIELEDNLDAASAAFDQPAAKPKQEPVKVAAAQPVKKSAPAPAPAPASGSNEKCDKMLAAGNLTGRGSSNAFNCYKAMLANNSGDIAAKEGLEKVELALVEEFDEEIKEKSLQMAKSTLSELRRANPRSKHLRKMKMRYEELKMEMRW